MGVQDTSVAPIKSGPSPIVLVTQSGVGGNEGPHCSISLKIVCAFVSRKTR